MALKGREWFFGCCYTEVRQLGPLAHLSDRALELGFKREKTGGHILQACGAAQKFLMKYPNRRNAIRRSAPHLPFELKGQILQDWLAFFSRQGNKNYHKTFGYKWKSLRTYLTAKYGGTCKGGGGGNNEFKIVMRLMAEFK